VYKRQEQDSVPVESYELPFKRLTVKLGNRSMVLYLPR